MTTRRNKLMWNHSLWAGASLALALGCASTAATGPETGKLPDEDWAPGKQEKAAGGAAAGESGPVEIPSIAKKAAARQITEAQKADFDKAVAEYQKAKKGGTLPGPDCGSVASRFKSLADSVPVLLEARNNEATVHLECGRKDDAVRIWESMNSGGRTNATALANLGYVAWQSGNKTGAETMFTRAIAADPLVGSIPARINMAQILRERARNASGADKRQYNDQAVKELRRVLALDGNSLQAYAGLCYIYFDLGLPEAAKLVGAQAVKRAQEIATGKFEDEGVTPEDTGRKAKKGKAKKGEEEKEEGKASQETAAEGTGYTVEMKRAVAFVHNTLGLIALDKKNYTEAIRNFDNAVQNDPNLFESRMNLAAVSLKFRNYGTAEENFRAVITAQPRNYEAIIGLAVALRGNRKLDEAEAEYNKAKTLDPQRGEAYFDLGLLYQEYKAGSDKPMLQKAQAYYRDFLQHGGSPKMRTNAEKRIKDIDEVFVALDEAAKMMKEAEEMQRKAEEQAKKMEEEMKRMEAEEKRQQEEAAKKAEEDKKKAEEDKKKAEEDKKKAEEEKAKKAEEDKKKAEEEKAKKAEDKKKAEEEKAKKAEEEKAKKAADGDKKEGDKAAGDAEASDKKVADEGEAKDGKGKKGKKAKK